jgi:phosphoglycolate phosphatase-like HAD superfamily hydrolase
MDLSQTNIYIFDVNGVLLDSNLRNAEAMARAFTDDPSLQGCIVELYLKLTGIDRGSKIRIVQDQCMRRPFHEGEFELRWEKVKECTFQSMSEAPLFPGCRTVLLELGKKGLTRAALSNTPRVELERILQTHRLASYFDIIRGGGDWPKIESLRRLVKEFGFYPEECVFLGDGKGDAAAAGYAGVAFAAIDPGSGEFDDEVGCAGRYSSLAEWAEKELDIEVGLQALQPAARS